MIIKTISDVLSQKQCEEFIQWGETGRYQMMGKDYPASYRNNDRMVADRPELAKSMQEMLQQHLPKQLTVGGETWDLVGLNPRFRGCRYRGGQNFTRHRDGAYSPDESTRSFLTVMLYLNDHSEFSGGATRFYADRFVEQTEQVVRPETGLAILFSHDYWHDGEAVTEGTKYVLRTDVLYRSKSASTVSHRGYIWMVKELRDGRLITGSRDKTIRVWGTQGGTLRTQAVLKGHSASVTSLAPQSAGFVSGSRDRHLIWWNHRLQKEREVEAHEGAILSLLPLTGDELLSAGADGFLKRWSARGELISQIEIGGWLWAVESVSQGYLCATESGQLVLIDRDLQKSRSLYQHNCPLMSVKSMNGQTWVGTANGELLNFCPSLKLRTTQKGHRGALTALEVTSEGTVVSGGEDDGVFLWSDGRPHPVAQHNDFVRSLCLTADGDLVSASYDGTLKRNRLVALV